MKTEFGAALPGGVNIIRVSASSSPQRSAGLNVALKVLQRVFICIQILYSSKSIKTFD